MNSVRPVGEQIHVELAPDEAAAVRGRVHIPVRARIVRAKREIRSLVLAPTADQLVAYLHDAERAWQWSTYKDVLDALGERQRCFRSVVVNATVTSPADKADVLAAQLLRLLADGMVLHEMSRLPDLGVPASSRARLAISWDANQLLMPLAILTSMRPHEERTVHCQMRRRFDVEATLPGHEHVYVPVGASFEMDGATDVVQWRDVDGSLVLQQMEEMRRVAHRTADLGTVKCEPRTPATSDATPLHDPPMALYSFDTPPASAVPVPISPVALSVPILTPPRYGTPVRYPLEPCSISPASIVREMSRLSGERRRGVKRSRQGSETEESSSDARPLSAPARRTRSRLHLE